MKHRLYIHDQPHDIWLARRAGGDVLIHDDKEYSLASRKDAVVAVDGDMVYIHLDGNAYTLRYEHPLDRFAHEGLGAAEDMARAPMPGSVIAVHVKPGDTVTPQTALLVIESMKLETVIKASRDGVIESVKFTVGQTFDRDAVLVTLVPQEG